MCVYVYACIYMYIYIHTYIPSRLDSIHLEGWSFVEFVEGDMKTCCSCCGDGRSADWRRAASEITSLKKKSKTKNKKDGQPTGGGRRERSREAPTH
jgi:hypothetical protein